MTKDEVVTLEDALRYNCEQCTDTLKNAWEHVKEVHAGKTAAQQTILLHRAFLNTCAEHPDALFPLVLALIGKFLVPELTPEEQYSIRMYDMRSKDNE